MINELVSTDADLCSNNTVRYYFEGQLSVNSPFQIDPLSGQVFLSTALLSDDPLSYTTTLAVEDRLSPVATHRTGTAQLTVIIGELLPVDFAVSSGFVVPPLSRTSDTEFKQGTMIIRYNYILVIVILLSFRMFIRLRIPYMYIF